MVRIVLTFGLLLGFNAGAGELTRWKHAPDGATQFWIQRAEEGRIFVQQLRLKPGRLQEITEHHAFDTPALAEAFFTRVTEGYAGTRPSRPNELSTEVRSEKIWASTREWTTEWEEKFAIWIRDNINATFYSRHNIRTDCADVPVAARWIFARINGLPAVNHLMGTGALFGNESMREEWLALKTGPNWATDARFRAALEYILVHSYTHSLLSDLYPVKISAKGVVPGTVLLHLYNGHTGHAEMVRWVGHGQASAIEMIASTVPRKLRELPVYGIHDWGKPPVAGKDGLFRFLWPVRVNASYALAPRESMPLFSEEQYAPGFSAGHIDFTEAVIAKVVPNWTYDPALALRARTVELLDRMNERVKVVEEGYRICSAKRCVEGTSDWENWSTPSRDAAVYRLLGSVEDIYGSTACRESCQQELDGRRSVEITKIGMPYTLDYAIQAWLGNRFSSDPNDEISRRWGW